MDRLARVPGLLGVVHGNSIPREVFLDLGMFAFLGSLEGASSSKLALYNLLCASAPRACIVTSTYSTYLIVCANILPTPGLPLSPPVSNPDQVFHST